LLGVRALAFNPPGEADSRDKRGLMCLAKHDGWSHKRILRGLLDNVALHV
jgi:hypothetical protein